MNKYIRPQVEIKSFQVEDVITASGTNVPSVNPEALVKKGYSIGTIKNLFN